ncbi:hypothetical protein ALP75_202999 [Pseudomonas syringae pv. actinidiae]|nr:hypothetical protein ALP75_202999 [Pseudomonas syringae pv. actinidiae]
MPGHRIAPFAIEPEQTGQATFSRMMTVWAISNRLSTRFIHKLQDRTLLIGCQQCGFQHTVHTPLLGQQQIFMLKDHTPQRALYLGRQTVLLIEALNIRLASRHTGSQSVQWVVVILAQYRLI